MRGGVGDGMAGCIGALAAPGMLSFFENHCDTCDEMWRLELSGGCLELVPLLAVPFCASARDSLIVFRKGFSEWSAFPGCGSCSCEPPVQSGGDFN